MRVSTNWHQQLSADAILNQQSKLVTSQLKLSSGKRILTPSEDPSSAVKLVDLDHSVKINQQYQDNIGFVRQRLSLEESSLRSAVDVVQKIRELGVQGLNDSNSAANRHAIALEMSALNDQLLGLANTQNSNGEYIFSGFKSNVPAFSKTGAPPVYSYNGDGNQRLIQIGPARQVTDGDPGQSAFGVIGTDNIMEAVQRFSAAMDANAPLASSLAELDTGLNNIGNTQASVGARLNALDKQEAQNADYILDSKTAASRVGDLDYAEAMSQFNLQQISLQAAQQAYMKVQDLSLFKFI
jgi:flagellar hook-associated protein 3 FlgL